MHISKKFDRVWQPKQTDISDHYDRQAKESEPEFAFLNFGYAEGDETGRSEALLKQVGQALYHHAVARTRPQGKDILEIGSGLGGGAVYVAETFSPQSMTGMDISREEIRLTNSLEKPDNLSFQWGDAMDLPFPDNSFHVILNVESSHCYPSIPRFLGEVWRCLRPGGLFSICDTRTSDGWRELLDLATLAGFHTLEQDDITTNVVRALDLTSPWKEFSARKISHPAARQRYLDITAARGTGIYLAFLSGELIYGSGLFRKSWRTHKMS